MREQGSTSRRAAPGSALAVGVILSARYQLLDYIGEGGMGLVYKAHDAALDEIVAIKVLRPQLLADQLMRQRFLSEIKLARRVTHKNVCRIHDYGEDGPRSYISMQFVEGVELKTLARQSPRLSAEEAYDLAIPLADGLQAIHDAGIIHRDFKSANVMVDARGDPRLMDFGIAKQWESKTPTELTTQGMITGTPEYMSPEQASGEPLDPRSDLYAMGIVLFELFTGTRPFVGDNIASVLYKQIYEPPPLDGEAAAALPAAVKPIIQRTLAKRREDRFATASELKSALTAARASLTPTPSDTTETIRARVQAVHADTSTGPGRRRTLYWLTAAALLVVAAIAAALSASTLLGPRAPEPAPTPTPSTTNTPTKNTPATNTPATKTEAASGPPATVVDAAAACQRGDGGACLNACEHGSPTACTQMGVLHNRGGAGIARDLGAAALYYERGCNGGDLAGCNNLGTLYQFGALGLQGDRAKAATLYERACSGGHQEACANLGFLYIDDRDADPSRRSRARQLLQQACSAGITRACSRGGP